MGVPAKWDGIQLNGRTPTPEVPALVTFSSTCWMVFIGLSTTDTSGGFHSLQFHETTDKQAIIRLPGNTEAIA